MRNQLYLLRIIIGFYLLCGGGFFFCMFLYRPGILGILNSLIPSTITILVLLFFLISGYTYGFKQKSDIGPLLARISLWMQAIQLVLLGYTFKNYYGPYLGVGFTDTPELDFVYTIKLFTYKFGNGFNKTSEEVSIVFNFIAIIFLTLVYFIDRKEKLIQTKSLHLDSQG